MTNILVMRFWNIFKQLNQLSYRLLSTTTATLYWSDSHFTWATHTTIAAVCLHAGCLYVHDKLSHPLLCSSMSKYVTEHSVGDERRTHLCRNGRYMLGHSSSYHSIIITIRVIYYTVLIDCLLSGSICVRLSCYKAWCSWRICFDLRRLSFFTTIINLSIVHCVRCVSFFVINYGNWPCKNMGESN